MDTPNTFQHIRLDTNTNKENSVMVYGSSLTCFQPSANSSN